MGTSDETWIARVTPGPGRSVEDLLDLSLGLDVWERHTDSLVVAAPDSRLGQLEGRRLARVERLITTAQYLAQRRDGRRPAGEG